MVNPRDPVSSIQSWIKTGDVAVVTSMLEKVDLGRFGGDLLSMACMAG